MTAYATNQAGVWSNSAIWTPNGVPGNGDTATVAHAVTISGDETIGNSPAAGNTVLACTAALTIASTGSLTLKGDMTLNNCRLICNGDFTFDASGAASPSSQNYICKISTAHNQYGAYVTFTGTSGAHTQVSSNSGGGNGRFHHNGFIAGGVVQAQYVDFTRIGTASVNAVSAYVNNSSSCQPVYFKNCQFDSCGLLAQAVSYGTPAAWYIWDCNFANSLGSTCVEPTLSSTATVSILRNAFDKGSNLYTGNQIIQDNVFGGRIGFLNNTSNGTVFTGNLIRSTVGSETVFYDGDATDNYYYSTVTSNPHDVGIKAAAGATITHSGWIIDNNASTSADGDCFTPSGSSGAGNTIVVKNCIILPTGNNSGGGTLLSLLDNGTTTWQLLHNTTSYHVYCGETNDTVAGAISLFKSNITWKAGTATAKVDEGPFQTTNDFLAAANADYNCGWNVTAGAAGKGYDITHTSGGTYGANDIDENPVFVDSTRNIATWGAHLGGAGTAAASMTELLKLNTSAHNPNYTVANLHAWVKAGFAPRNKLLENAGHDGVTVGAVEGRFGGAAAKAVIIAATAATRSLQKV